MDDKKTENELIAQFMGWKNLGKSESGLNMWRTDKAPIGTTLIADTLGEDFRRKNSMNLELPKSLGQERRSPVKLKVAA